MLPLAGYCCEWVESLSSAWHSAILWIVIYLMDNAPPLKHTGTGNPMPYVCGIEHLQKW